MRTNGSKELSGGCLENADGLGRDIRDDKVGLTVDLKEWIETVSDTTAHLTKTESNRNQ